MWWLMKISLSTVYVICVYKPELSCTCVSSNVSLCLGLRLQSTVNVLIRVLLCCRLKAKVHNHFALYFYAQTGLINATHTRTNFDVNRWYAFEHHQVNFSI